MKRIIITGCTKGLGRALTEEFIALGHIVCGCGRNLREINQLSNLHPFPHFFAKVDVRDDADVHRWANHCLEKGPAPDILINNAAVIARNAPLWQLSASEADAVFDTNIKGVTNVLRHFLPAMIQRGSGIIVNFSSGWGRSTSPEVATYCASKYAIEGLTSALAQELPKGLAAIALNPGIINTAMLQSCFGTNAANYPTPEQWVKSAAPFILSLSTQHNGRSLTVPQP